jgi:hypothetical protein
MSKPSPEVLIGLVMAAAIWGVNIEAALVLVVLGCIGALVWRRSRR